MSGRLRTWVAIGLGLGAAAPVAAAEPPPPPAPMAETPPLITDASIAADIKARLDHDKTLRSARISIASSNGVVTLVGTVPNEFAHDRAFEIARATPGVARVDDFLRLDISSPQAPAPSY